MVKSAYCPCRRLGFAFSALHCHSQPLLNSSSRVSDVFTPFLLPVHTSGTDIELGTHASIKNIISELKKKHTHAAGSDMIEKKVGKGSVGTAE